MTPDTWAAIVATVVLGIIGFLSVRTLNQIDKNQKEIAGSLLELWKEHNSFKLEFTELKAEHHIHHDRRSVARETWPGERD